MPPKKRKLARVLKFQAKGAAAEPAKLGSILGPAGINLMGFVKEFNEASKDRKGQPIPVELSVYEDRSFDFKLKTTPAAHLLKEAAKVDKGSATPHTKKVGTVTAAQVREIAQAKLEDLNADDLDQAAKIIAGTARSMGITVQG